MRAFWIGFGAAIFPVFGVLWGAFASAVNIWYFRLDYPRALFLSVALTVTFGVLGFMYAVEWLEDHTQDMDAYTGEGE